MTLTQAQDKLLEHGWPVEPDAMAEKQLQIMVLLLAYRGIECNEPTLEEYVMTNKDILIEYENYSEADINNIIRLTQR